MLNGTLELWDIRDAEAYCAGLLRNAKLNLTTDDHEDALAYLIETAWELSTKDPQPWRTSFSGWLTPILRLRIVDWQRQRHGRSTWQFKNHTYQRARPELVSYEAEANVHSRNEGNNTDRYTDRLARAITETHRDPPRDRDASDLVRLLRTRSSDEAWRTHKDRKSLSHRAA
jgi:DNA-directed RNA polymerase specialized sigma24 family protein